MTNDEEHPGVAKVKKMWERGDFETIEKMVAFWEAVENLGKAGDLLRRFVIWCGIIASGYLVFSGYLVDWLRGLK